MFTHRISRFRAASFLAAAALSLQATAATYQWDANGATAGLGGTGTWDATGLTWDLVGTAPDNGTGATTAPTFTAADIAQFGGTAGTVTLAAPVTLNGLIFNTKDYQLTGGTITLAGTTPTITTSGAATDSAIVASVLAGTGGFTKTGAAILVLSGTNTITGGIKVQQGTLKLGASGALAAGSSVTVDSGASFDFGGQGNANRNLSLTIAGTGVNGQGAITNSGVSVAGNAGVTSITLAGDASVGGVSRWDIGNGTAGKTFNGNGYTLTKVGANQIVFRPETVTNLAGVNINQGTWTYEKYSRTTAATAGMVNTVADGATLDSFGDVTLNMPLVFNGRSNLTNGSGTATWTGQVTINGTLNVNSGNPIKLTGPIGGAGGIVKQGAGTLTLSGTNTYAGGTTVNAGTLLLDYGTNNTGKLADGAELTLAKSQVRFVGNAGADTTELVGGLVVNGGASLYLDTAAGRVLTVDFTGTSGTATGSYASGLYIGTTGTGTTRVKLPGAGVNTAMVSGVVYNHTFAGTDASGYLTQGSAVVSDATDLATWVSGATQYTTTGADFTNSVGGITIDGITFKDTAARTVTITGGQRLTLTKGVIVTPEVGANASLITGGQIQGAAGGMLTLFNANTQGTFSLNSWIRDNGGSGLIKTGAGTVYLGSTGNDYAGLTVVDGGTLQLGSNTALGTTAQGTVVNAGATLDINGKNIGAELVTLNGGTLLNSAAAAEGRVNAVVVNGDSTLRSTGDWINLQSTTGTGKLIIESTVAAKGVWNNTAGATYANAGGIELRSGTFDIYGTVKITGGPVLVTGGTLNTKDVDNIGDALAVTVNGGTWNVSGAEVVGSLAGTGGTVSIGTSLTVGDATDTTYAGTLSGNGSLIKQGSGTMSIGSRATHTGGTTVKSGVLALTGGGGSSGTLRGTVTVNDGATLRLATGDATGYGTGAGSLTTINLNGGTLDINKGDGTNPGNQTLGGATINMTGGAITGVAGSNIDFFAGGSKINTLASDRTSTISASTISLRQTGGLTLTTEDGAAAIDLDIRSVIRNTDPGALIKAGAGSVRLAGANTHNGGTLINAGTVITANTSALGSGAVTLSGGTLRIGDGTVNTVALGAGSGITVTPAADIVLGFTGRDSAITLTGGGKYDFSGAHSVTLDLGNAFNQAGDYHLITGGTGNLDASKYAFTGIDTSNYGYSFANGILSVTTAIPEPTTYGLLGAGAAAAVALVRRRRRAK